MSIAIEDTQATESESGSSGFILDPCDIPEIDTTEPPEPDSVGKTVSGQRDHSLREPLPEFDTLTDIRWFCHREYDPTVDGVLGQLGLDEDEWRGVIEGIVAGEEVLGHNPIQAEEVSDDLRAALLWEYLRSIQNVCPNPLLMPLKAENKEPKIVGRCPLDSEEGMALLHSPAQAVEAIRDGHPGFCLYASKERHNTKCLSFVDHDDMDGLSLDELPETLTVRSGSSRGFHETFISEEINSGSQREWGELKGHNENVVLPGSIHPSGGVYHTGGLREPSVLSESDLPEKVQPSTGSESTSDSEVDWDSISESDGHEGTYTNRLRVPLERCREVDPKLDQMLSTPYPDFLDTKDESQIESKLVWRLRYNHFADSEIYHIIPLRPRDQKKEKHQRTDYLRMTVTNTKRSDRRFTPADYFGSEDDPTHLVLMPEVETDRQDSPSLDTESVRDRRNNILRTAMNDGERVLVDCLPSIGKSYGTVKIASATDSALSIFTSRHDLYEQYQEWCSDFDLSYYTLPSFHHDCETANGDCGDEWQQAIEGLYQKGVSGQEIHQHARSYFGEELPCGGECSWEQNRDFNPNNYDVLIGNYVHAHNNTLIEGRTTVFDEFPADSFTQEFGGSTVTNAVSAYLSKVDELPFSDTTDLIEQRNDPTKRMKARRWFADQDLIPDSSVVLEGESRSNDTHAYAPLMSYSLLMGSDLENGFETATLDQSQFEEGERPERQSARRRHDGRLWLLEPPDLSDAEGLLCLDGTPSQSLWELCLDEGLEHTQVLSDDEREEYLTKTDGRSIIQTASGAAKPYSSGEHVATEQDGALFKAVRREMGSMPPVISTKNALSQYVETGVLPEDTETEHYGNMKGMNRFSDNTAGIVSGSKHHGDGYIKRWCALNDEPVSRTDDSNTGDKGLSYTTEFGNEVLKTMRDSQTLQSTMRFGRNNDQDSVTFVNTDTLPKWVPVQDDVSVRKISDGMREVIYAIAAIEAERGSDGEHSFTTKDITNRTNVSQQCVSNHMSTLSEYGYVTKHRPKNAINWKINTLPFNPFDAEGSTT